MNMTGQKPDVDGSLVVLEPTAERVFVRDIRSQHYYNISYNKQ